jgi:hypothetical protein
MRLSPIRKRLTICLSSVLLMNACASACPAPPSVLCHQWTRAEKLQHYQDDVAMPHENSLHGIIKDYERVCAALP